MKIVFDLDGTLANIDHRTHFVRNGKRDWVSFFKACVDDMPVAHAIAANTGSQTQVDAYRALHEAFWRI